MTADPSVEEKLADRLEALANHKWGGPSLLELVRNQMPLIVSSLRQPAGVSEEAMEAVAEGVCKKMGWDRSKVTFAVTAPRDDEICFIERSKVREILAGVADEHVHITETLLEDINKLPALLNRPQTGEVENEFSTMLFKWFGDRGALSQAEYQDGMTADDFKTMLDEHEAALTGGERQ